MMGPGKYDEVCTAARLAAKAQGAILIVIEGEFGSGFSAQLPKQSQESSALMLQRLASVLRQLTRQIEKDALKYD